MDKKTLIIKFESGKSFPVRPSKQLEYLHRLNRTLSGLRATHTIIYVVDCAASAGV